MLTKDQVQIFSEVLWEQNDRIEVRLIPLQTGARRDRFWLPARQLVDRIHELRAKNEAAFHVFAGVCPRLRDGGKKVDVALCRVLWADFDGISPEEALARIEEADRPHPTLVISSGHGTHAYWRLTEPAPLGDVEALLKRLAQLLDSDPSVTDIARVMRLPGFQNWKDPVEPCDIYDAEHVDCRYDVADLASKLPELSAPDPLPVHSGNGSNLRAALRYVATLDGMKKGHRNNVAFRLGASLRRGFELPEAESELLMRAWNSLNEEPLSSDELRACLASGWENGQEPIGGRLRATASDAVNAQTLSAIEFLSMEFPEPKWLVDGIWRRAGCGFITGPPKSRKSILDLDMAVAIASGQAFLGHEVPEPGRVLVVDIENSPADLQDRLRKILKARNLKPDDLGDNLRIWSQPRLALDTPEGVTELEEEIRRFRPSLVMIDPLVRCHTQDENSATEMAKVLTPLRLLQARHQCGILLVHHAKRAERYTQMSDLLRGTGDFYGWLDSGIGVDRKGEIGKIYFAQRSGPELDPLSFTVGFEPDRIVIAHGDAGLEDDERRHLELTVIGLLHEKREGLTKNQIRDRTGRSGKDTGRVLNQLIERKAVKTKPGKSSRNQKVTLYVLA